MGGEQTWWSWGSQTRSTSINATWPTWNDSSSTEYPIAFNFSGGGVNASTWPEDDVSIETLGDYDLLVTVLIAILLIFLIIATIIGKRRV
ncbi:hypothetical protein TKK_0004353 [Trichogramma kaykai]